MSITFLTNENKIKLETKIEEADWTKVDSEATAEYYQSALTETGAKV